MTPRPGRRGHLRLVKPCAPLPAAPGAVVQLHTGEVLVGVLVGRPYVRTVDASTSDGIQIPPLRAAMNFYLLAEDHLVVIDGDEGWLADVMALHRSGGVEAWVVSVGRRSGSEEPSALRAYRERSTTAGERERLAGLRLHDLDALLGPAPGHGPPHLRLVPSSD
jgi:hypothetical protein